jgi:hypothetical protein
VAVKAELQAQFGEQHASQAQAHEAHGDTLRAALAEVHGVIKAVEGTVAQLREQQATDCERAGEEVAGVQAGLGTTRCCFGITPPAQLHVHELRLWHEACKFQTRRP